MCKSTVQKPSPKERENQRIERAHTLLFFGKVQVVDTERLQLACLGDQRLRKGAAVAAGNAVALEHAKSSGGPGRRDLHVATLLHLKL